MQKKETKPNHFADAIFADPELLHDIETRWIAKLEDCFTLDGELVHEYVTADSGEYDEDGFPEHPLFHSDEYATFKELSDAMLPEFTLALFYELNWNGWVKNLEERVGPVRRLDFRPLEKHLLKIEAFKGLKKRARAAGR